MGGRIDATGAEVEAHVLGDVARERELRLRIEVAARGRLVDDDAALLGRAHPLRQLAAQVVEQRHQLGLGRPRLVQIQERVVRMPVRARDQARFLTRQLDQALERRREAAEVVRLARRLPGDVPGALGLGLGAGVRLGHLADAVDLALGHPQLGGELGVVRARLVRARRRHRVVQLGIAQRLVVQPRERGEQLRAPARRPWPASGSPGPS